MYLLIVHVRKHFFLSSQIFISIFKELDAFLDFQII